MNNLMPRILVAILLFVVVIVIVFGGSLNNSPLTGKNNNNINTLREYTDKLEDLKFLLDDDPEWETSFDEVKRQFSLPLEP
jgi:hypothetical protein